MALFTYFPSRWLIMMKINYFKWLLMHPPMTHHLMNIHQLMREDIPSPTAPHHHPSEDVPADLPSHYHDEEAGVAMLDLNICIYSNMKS